jgi:hypothetical protein
MWRRISWGWWVFTCSPRLFDLLWHRPRYTYRLYPSFRTGPHQVRPLVKSLPWTFPTIVNISLSETPVVECYSTIYDTMSAPSLLTFILNGSFKRPARHGQPGFVEDDYVFINNTMWTSTSHLHNVKASLDMWPRSMTGSEVVAEQSKDITYLLPWTVFNEPTKDGSNLEPLLRILNIHRSNKIRRSFLKVRNRELTRCIQRHYWMQYLSASSFRQ